VDHRYDPERKDCVCSRTSCCPPDHTYSAAVKACVCNGDSCCPAGYRKDPAGERCVCTNDAACGPGNFCDASSGACLCRNNSGCKPGQYCNTFGFCQALGNCTTNADCPPGNFCDITTDRCIPNGPCTLDEHCGFGQLCDPVTARCRPGCRRDADCADKQACEGGQCRPFCRINASCSVNLFCAPNMGACGTRSGRVDCRDCTGASGVCGSGASCLTFISEGQTRNFCGTHCSSNEDCPSGFDCTEVIFSCTTGEGGSCPADSNAPGQTFTCRSFQVENESGTRFYCADATGQPHVYIQACAPLSGFCPATELP
jgi:hypothetical protein